MLRRKSGGQRNAGMNPRFFVRIPRLASSGHSATDSGWSSANESTASVQPFRRLEKANIAAAFRSMRTHLARTRVRIPVSDTGMRTFST